MKCPVCDWIKNKSNMLFENASAFVMLSPEPWVPGHILVIPKDHVSIIEQLSDEQISSLFELANKAGMCAFEGLNAQGTNVLIQNGVPAGQKYGHVIVNVVPRFENDNLKLTWTPKPAELSEIEQKFKEQQPEKKVEKKEEPVEDWRTKVLRRIP